MSLDVLAYLGYGLILMSVVMGVLYGVYRTIDEPSLADIGWAAGLGALSISYFYFTEEIGLRQIIVLIAALIWSLRLVIHLFIRFRKGLADKRYQYLSEIWKDNLSRNYFVFYIVQGLTAVAMSIAFAIAMLNDAPFNVWDILGIILFLIGILGEGFADWTLKHFRENPSNQSEVCQKGLWRYSRHPNYFFEIIIWIGFAFFAISAPFGFLGLLAPLIVWFFIQFISGVPLTEKQLLSSKGDKYREYQRTTSMLIPWLHK